MSDLAMAHKQLSIDCFNNCWTYLDKSEHTAEDREQMILLASASLWHWQQREDCQPRNLSIGYWQVARAYAVADEPGMSLFFAERCLEVSAEAELDAFCLGYALEAKARALAMGQGPEAAQPVVAAAEALLDKIEDADDRALLAADLETLKA